MCKFYAFSQTVDTSPARMFENGLFVNMQAGFNGAFVEQNRFKIHGSLETQPHRIAPVPRQQGTILIDDEPAGAVGAAQHIVVPHVRVAGFPSPESRCWTDGIQHAPKTGGRGNDPAPVCDGKQPSTEILDNGNTLVVIHLGDAFAHVDCVALATSVQLFESADLLGPYSSKRAGVNVRAY
jgi:hypothetical protein